MKFKLPRLSLACLAFIVLTDQVTKYAVVSKMEYLQNIPVFLNVSLFYIHNPGGAFSLLAEMPWWVRHPLFLSVTLAALWIGYSYWKMLPGPDKLSEIALGLVAGGAVGNQIDRLRLGEVIDFLRVDIPTGWLQWISASISNPYTYPIFNVADSAVCVGISLLVWRLFRPLPTSLEHHVS